MQRDLRRKQRGMDEAAAWELLGRGEYGILSTCGPDGIPYGVPLSYCVLDDGIYFHCALEGHKVDNISARKEVSFCVVGRTEVLPAEFATLYESVVASGPAEEVFDQEKQKALEALVDKYSCDYRPQGLKYIEAAAAKTKVFRIGVNAICGKARL
jgi:uncharacterized protein